MGLKMNEYDFFELISSFNLSKTTETHLNYIKVPLKHIKKVIYKKL